MRGGVAVGVDVVAFTIVAGELRVLVEHSVRGRKEWSLPGDTLGEREAPGAAAERILRSRLGPRAPYHEQLYTFGAPPRDPEAPLIRVAYFAVVPAPRVPPHAHFRAATRALGLAPGQTPILDEAIERLRTKAEYSTVPLRFLEEPFTLSDVQSIYEVLLERPLDKRNFRRKMLALDAIEQVEGVRRGGAHRPARLFRLSPERPYLLKERGILFPF